MVVEVDHPRPGGSSVLGNPLMMSETTQEYHPRLLGAHNEEVLTPLGLRQPTRSPG